MARITKTKRKRETPVREDEFEAAMPSARAVVPSAKAGTKAHTLIALLKSKRGATIAGLMSATGWQEHSVRGFLSGALRKRFGLRAVSKKASGEPRRYCVG